MLKKLFGPFFALCFLLAACQPLPETSNPSTVVLPPVTSAPITETPAGPAPLTQIPMQVGYGVSGSWFDYISLTRPIRLENKLRAGRMVRL